MFPFRPADDADDLRPLTHEHHQLLLQLVQHYGVPSLLCALTGSPDSSRASTFSTSTLFSSMSAPSLAWTSSAASQCRSDDASMHSQATWPDVTADVHPMHDPESSKISERSWLDSPVPVASPLPLGDVTSHPSPQLACPTSKKYQCPMCFLDNSPVGFGRKSDFKKHLHNFHGSDVVWICRNKACQLSFSTERAYSTHAKEAHRMKALPNSVARTELCAQVVFPCGFDACRDRIFEAQTADDASAARDRHFEHIAKHFEDGFDVRRWDYSVQIQNLMRQPQVKPVWKTCIWPKEKRQQLLWRPRSSGDLKRMLECRHLGGDVSHVVRLAYILGTPPYSSPVTAPMSDVDMYFQLPHRGLCLIDSPGHSATAASPKPEDDAASTVTVSNNSNKRRSSLTQSVFRLPSRQGKRASRPPTPASAPVADTAMGDDVAAGPHPGTPFPIPNETVWPADAPKFAPEAAADLRKPPSTPAEDPGLLYPLHVEQNPPPSSWCVMDSFDAYHGQMDDVPQGVYDYGVDTSQGSAAGRPATPAPVAHKRPASWSRAMGMEMLRPTKKAASLNNNAAGPPEMMPTMLGL